MLDAVFLSGWVFRKESAVGTGLIVSGSPFFARSVGFARADARPAGSADGGARNHPEQARASSETESSPTDRHPGPGPSDPAPGAEVFRFVLTDVLVDGNTVYTEDELLPLWEGLLGQENTLTLFYGIAAAISVRYCNDGYILARAFVPPQEIIDGFTDIEVIEGYINNIVIEGEQSGSAAQIEDKKEAINASQPLRAPDRGKFHNCGTQYALNLEEGTLS